MRSIAHPGAEQMNLSGVLHALSDPVRLAIIGALRDGGEMPCGRLPVPVSKSTLSHHLKVLRDAGITRTRVDGVQRYVSLRTEEVERRFPGLLVCVLSHTSTSAVA